MAYSIHENIRMYRKKLGYTLEELAKKLNTSKQTIHRYETGEIKSIPYEKIMELSSVLEVEPSTLMGWEKPGKDDAILLSSLVNDRLLMSAIQKIINMDYEQKMKVYDYIDFQLYKTNSNNS